MKKSMKQSDREETTFRTTPNEAQEPLHTELKSSAAVVLTDDQPPRLSKAVEQSLKAVAKGGTVTFVGRVLGQVFNYVAKILIARFWGPADYGLISLGITVFTIGSAIALLGLPTGITRFVAYYREEENPRAVREVVMSGLRIALPAGLVLAGLISLYAAPIANQVFHEPNLTPILRVFAVALLFYSFMRLFTAGLQGFEDMRHMVYSQNLVLNGGVVLLVLLAMLLRLGSGVLPYAYLASFIVAASVALWYLWPRLRYAEVKGAKTVNSPPRLTSKLLCFSWPLLFSGILLSLRYHTDRIMIGIYEGATQVGIYNAVVLITLSLFLISGSLTPIFLPILTRLYQANVSTDLKVTFQAVCRWLFYVTYPMLLIALFFPETVIGFLYGVDYISAVPILRILVLGFLALLLSGLGGTLIQAVGRTGIFLMVEMLGTGANIVLNLLLIPRLGIQGAAYATAASYFVTSISILCIIKKGLGFFAFQVRWLKYALPMTLILGLARLSVSYSSVANQYLMTLIIAVAATLVGVTAGLWVAKFNQEDRIILTAISKRIGLKRHFI